MVTVLFMQPVIKMNYGVFMSFYCALAKLLLQMTKKKFTGLFIDSLAATAGT